MNNKLVATFQTPSKGYTQMYKNKKQITTCSDYKLTKKTTQGRSPLRNKRINVKEVTKMKPTRNVSGDTSRNISVDESMNTSRYVSERKNTKKDERSNKKCKDSISKSSTSIYCTPNFTDEFISKLFKKEMTEIKNLYVNSYSNDKQNDLHSNFEEIKEGESSLYDYFNNYKFPNELSDLKLSKAKNTNTNILDNNLKTKRSKTFNLSIELNKFDKLPSDVKEKIFFDNRKIYDTDNALTLDVSGSTQEYKENYNKDNLVTNETNENNLISNENYENGLLYTKIFGIEDNSFEGNKHINIDEDDEDNTPYFKKESYVELAEELDYNRDDKEDNNKYEKYERKRKPEAFQTVLTTIKNDNDLNFTSNSHLEEESNVYNAIIESMKKLKKRKKIATDKRKDTRNVKNLSLINFTKQFYDEPRTTSLTSNNQTSPKLLIKDKRKLMRSLVRSHDNNANVLFKSRPEFYKLEPLHKVITELRVNFIPDDYCFENSPYFETSPLSTLISKVNNLFDKKPLCIQIESPNDEKSNHNEPVYEADFEC